MKNKSNTVSKKRLSTKRRNAQRSTGPRTAQGRDTTKMNALKRREPLPTTPGPIPQLHRSPDQFAALRPDGVLEEMFVEASTKSSAPRPNTTTTPPFQIITKRTHLSPADPADVPSVPSVPSVHHPNPQNQSSNSPSDTDLPNEPIFPGYLLASEYTPATITPVANLIATSISQTTCELCHIFSKRTHFHPKPPLIH